MANNETKTNAEIYREQRKASIAKANAKAKKKNKSGKGEKAIRIAVKVVAIILIVALVLFGLGRVLTNVFCVPQKVLTAAKFGDDKINVAEYNFYYNQLYNQAVQISQQYDQQYQGFGSQYFNTMVLPSEQKYPGEDAPKSVETWADYFKYYASQKAFITNYFYEEAMKSGEAKGGFKLTKEQQAEMDKQIKEVIDEISKNAKTANFSVNNYISRTLGEGLTEKSYRELITKELTQEYYLKWYQEKLSKDISDKDVTEYYNKNRADLDIVSFRFFAISYAKPEEGSKDPAYTKKEAEARAKQFVASVTDEASFESAAKKFAPPSLAAAYETQDATLAKNLKKASVDSLSENMSKWLFDSKRAYGETAIFESKEQSAYYAVYIVEPAHKDKSNSNVSVRHLLVEAKTTKEDTQGQQVPLSDAEIEKNFAEAKKEADKLLAQWKAGKHTEDTFIALVKEHTDDTASAETGGLYEDINSESQYVPEFLDWSLADHKKGDVGIVKTDYGYHIMYFVKADKTQKWEADVRTSIASKSFSDYQDKAIKTIDKKVEANDMIVNYFAGRTQKFIDSNIKHMLAQQNAQGIK